MKGWENQYRKARLNTISWDFPRREIILGVLQMPCTSQKPKPEPRNSPRNWEEKRRPKKRTERLPFQHTNQVLKSSSSAKAIRIGAKGSKQQKQDTAKLLYDTGKFIKVYNS
jgi:hypothetical protein